ncbi:hypothetical protein BDK51DRAFT_45441 [Blyttiomyces helicus]|uniref:UBX domain-containing protein n=1 Tax=Blyttiomyces helicus TaxID=388810 RepID=A0A4P9WLX1_9FUNG|nr:hypothetical protein BDK51DRAFT_45441 [Blyttiomyces helicus]|eukprot:RKO91676.1 hypothetical protein BDK51DRAFT_45441 [Blyttiomyces helicus]
MVRARFANSHLHWTALLFSHAEDPDPTEEELAALATGGGVASAGAGGASGDADDGEITADQATAQSLKCDDCGRILRDASAAEMHAIKTSHQNFSESTEAIKPLTPEEKAAKLAALQERLAAKREEKRLLEIQENKQREKVRRVTGKEMTDLKEKHKDIEMKKALDAKKKEKEDDRKAKERIKALLEADKQERLRKVGVRMWRSMRLSRLLRKIMRAKKRGGYRKLVVYCFLVYLHKAEEKKLAAQGLAPAAIASPPPVRSEPSQPVVQKDYTEARLQRSHIFSADSAFSLQIRVPDGPPITHTFSANDTLQAVYDLVAQRSAGNLRLMQTFPRKVLDDRGKTLKELNLVPSASLVAQI